MKVVYDKYYQTDNLFGKPSQELITFLLNYPSRGKLLDMGCGQGRDAIPLGRLGYKVIGIDTSTVGIRQMNKVAKAEKINVTGIVADIYSYDNFSDFEVILLDSMFHFYKKDLKRETELIKNIIKKTKKGTTIIFCVPNTGKKIKMLKETINYQKKLEYLEETDFQYEYKDDQSGQVSKTPYKMIVVKK